MPNPPQASDAFGLVQRGEKVHWPRCVSEVWGGEQELPRDDIRPDVIVQDADGELLVEVRVTHAVGQDKARAVRRLDLRMVEIDLSSTSAAVLADPAAFERWVLQEAPRHWIWLPAAARKWTESLRRLEDEIKLRGTPRSHIERPKPVAPPVPSPALAGWGEFRTLFAAREIESVDREPRVRDPLVGGTVTLPGLGIAKILERFARASRVYRVALADGSLRTIYLGNEPAGGSVTSADCRSAGARGSAKLLRPSAALAAD